MILMLHIIFGLTTLLVGAVALVLRKKELIKYQVSGLVGTIASGIVLVIVNPQTLVHLCVSGLVFTAISLALYYGTLHASLKSQV